VALAGIQQVGRNVGTNYLAGQKLPICVFDIDTNLADGALATTLLYHDFWSAIASGAKGVGIWSSFYMTAALRAQANVAASQITGSEQLGDVILNGVDASNVGFNITSGTTQTVSYASVSYPSLNVLAKVRNGNLYVIAVNSTDQTITANINSLPTSGSSATVLFQSRSLPVSGASVSDTFPAWGVNIYKLPLDTGTAPATPAGLSGTSPSGCEIDLSWTASTGATTYNIKRSTVNGGPYQTVATAVTGTSYSDSTLASSTPYYYVISAVNIYGESANSAQAAATTQVWTRMNDTTPAIIYGGATTYSANGTNGNIGYT